MKILIVVDMQNDFVTGSLGTKEAQAIVPAVKQAILDWDGEFYCTMDTHYDDYLQTQEGRNLPIEHCIYRTWGWDMEDEVFRALESHSQAGKEIKLYQKSAFGSKRLARALHAMQGNEPIEEIRLVGLCTDICIISNALLLKSYLPEVPIIVDATCCAGVTRKSHRTALAAMKACQIIIENG